MLICLLCLIFQYYISYFNIITSHISIFNVYTYIYITFSYAYIEYLYLNIYTGAFICNVIRYSMQILSIFSFFLTHIYKVCVKCLDVLTYSKHNTFRLVFHLFILCVRIYMRHILLHISSFVLINLCTLCTLS